MHTLLSNFANPYFGCLAYQPSSRLLIMLSNHSETSFHEWSMIGAIIKQVLQIDILMPIKENTLRNETVCNFVSPKTFALSHLILPVLMLTAFVVLVGIFVHKRVASNKDVRMR